MNSENSLDTTPLHYLGQVREKIVEYCDDKRFALAQLYLLQSNLLPNDHPSLWSFLARSAQDGGNEAVAHGARSALWNANVWTGQIAIEEARYYLTRNDHKSAAFVLDTVFGDAPEDTDARLLLARCELARIMADPQGGERKLTREQVADLLEGISTNTVEEVMTVVDLLRFAGHYESALERLEGTFEAFPDDVRLRLRKARILEQTGDILGAILIWEDAVEAAERYRTEGRFKLLGLYQRMDRDDDVNRIVTKLHGSDLRFLERLRLSLVKRQRGVVEALVESLSQGGAVLEEQSHDELIEISEILLDHGFVGLLLWLRRRRVAVSDRVKKVLDQAGYHVGGPREVPDSFDKARKIRSPEFLFPFAAFLDQDPRPAGWPGAVRLPCRILLVNASLKAGGAERQFVEMCRSLIQSGWPSDLIDVALYSLAQDRGHDVFLQDLEKLGVSIFDLSQRKIVNRSLPPSIGTMLSALPVDLRSDIEKLWHLVEERQPKVLHCWQDRSMLSGGIVGIASNLERVVLSARNMSPATRREISLTERQGLYAQFAHEANFAMTSNSRAGASDYEKWLRLEDGAFQTLSNSVDIERFRPDWRKPKEQSEPLCITGIFRLALNKRPLLWVKTVAELQRISDRPLEARIYGDGPLLREIEKMAQETGLKNLVIKTTASNPKELYSRADALLLMSRVEGVPNVVLEAQACGIPVAACDVGGVSEALHQEGKGRGLLLPAEVDPIEAAKAVLEWLPDAVEADPEDRLAFVRRSFGSAAFAARAMQLYSGEVP